MRLTLLFLFAPITAFGETQTLDADEVRDLLTGNTAIGYWVDHHYRQWFTDGGTTIYAPKEGRSSRGRWRVEDRTGAYLSEWNESGYWASFHIQREGGSYFWVSEDVPRQSFTIEQGEQLVWPIE